MLNAFNFPQAEKKELLKMTGLDYGFEPVEIVDVASIEYKLHFKVFFKGILVPEFVPGDRMRAEFPEVNAYWRFFEMAKKIAEFLGNIN